jgi:hypothetical protein
MMTVMMAKKSAVSGTYKSYNIINANYIIVVENIK